MKDLLDEFDEMGDIQEAEEHTKERMFKEVINEVQSDNELDSIVKKNWGEAVI